MMSLGLGRLSTHVSARVLRCHLFLRLIAHNDDIRATEKLEPKGAEMLRVPAFQFLKSLLHFRSGWGANLALI